MYKPIKFFPLKPDTDEMNKDNRRDKDQKLREIECGCFMPLHFTSFDDIGHSAKVMYKLRAMIVLKHDKPYSQTIDWLRLLPELLTAPISH